MKLSIWKYFSKILLKMFHIFQGFRQSYIRSGPFRSIPSIWNQRSLSHLRHEMKAGRGTKWASGGVNLDNTRSQIFPKWHQFCKLEVPTCRNMQYWQLSGINTQLSNWHLLASTLLKARPCTLQIYTVFNCAPLSTVISLYGLHRVYLYSGFTFNCLIHCKWV